MIGVEIHLHQNEWTFFSCLIHFDGKKFETSLGCRHADIDSLLLFLAEKPKEQILLNVFGPITIEKITNSPDPDISEILGVGIERSTDFQVQLIQASGDSKLAAAIRQEKLAEILTLFEDHKSRISSISISSGILGSLLFQLIEEESKSISFQGLNRNYHLDSNGFLSENPTQAINVLDGATLLAEAEIETDEANLLAHAYANVLLGESNLLATSFSEGEKKKQLYYRISRLALASCGLILAFLMLAYWTFHLQAKSLEQTYSINQPLLDQITSYRTEIETKQSFLLSMQTNELKQNHLAWVLDQISINRPPSLTFNRLLFHPNEELTKSILRGDSEEQYEIYLSGIAVNSSAITDFTFSLEKIKAVSAVAIIRSDYEFREERFNFLIGLNLEQIDR